ncbi:Rpp14/Pop5 family-domain-containing protein [Leucosporidium creatinivorum]|uniref:Ribonuclease P/MRP protein subunit POP5 n=1 Tax=Leucosporidium creatinivorum TaxID=106004 RepID=A0A1Y2FZ76_9BASI|nr:Rpp14/Pop5 family-domain-containing protein [Leucosporidium creatinivorum]ORY88507.1 Rpp14/Pop5 family-domain-containing protein [Leucosporidium creatinivorum]
MVRFKHRYLLLHLLFPTTLSNPLSDSNEEQQLPSAPTVNEAGLISLLRDSLSVNFGDVGAGEVGGSFGIKYLSPHTNILIIRVSREHYRTLWAALTLLRRIGGVEVIVRCLHVGGTIRKTQHAAIAYDRAEILEAAARRKRAERRRAKAVPLGDDVVEEMDEGTKNLLEQSEKELMEMEA